MLLSLGLIDLDIQDSEFGPSLSRVASLLTSSRSTFEAISAPRRDAQQLDNRPRAESVARIQLDAFPRHPLTPGGHMSAIEY